MLSKSIDLTKLNLAAPKRKTLFSNSRWIERKIDLNYQEKLKTTVREFFFATQAFVALSASPKVPRQIVYIMGKIICKHYHTDFI